jgi:hypothetical protein
MLRILLGSVKVREGEGRKGIGRGEEKKGRGVGQKGAEEGKGTFDV